MMKRKKFEELKIQAEKFKPGDIVLGKSGERTYTIQRFGQTFFHKYKFIHVVFDCGAKTRFYLDELVGKRTVLRRVE